MKKFLIFLFIFFIPVSSFGVVIDRVAAIVNDEVVTLSEIDEAEYFLVNNMMDKEKDQSRGDRKAVKKQILQRFIERKLQLQEAEKLKITATRENINDAIREIKDRNNVLNDKELEEALSLQGMTLDDLRRQITERIKIAKLINRRVRAKVHITEEEIKDYYQKHIVEFRLQEEVHAQHILLQVQEGFSSEKIEEIRSRMEKIAADLENGADFAETAKKYSEAPDAVNGGDLGYFKKGRMIPEIDKIVFALQAGERSGIVRTPFGFHIFEVLDRKEHTIDNDPDLRKEIEDRISKKKTDERMKEFIEELKEKAFININITEGS
jgi:peptidyl-prolyl cis-trans isomerase SurA